MFTTKHVLAAASALALIATPLLAQTNKDKSKGKSAQVSAQEFVTKAAVGGMFEVESSRIALDRSKRDDVRSFAQRMIDDHGKANSELEGLATKAGLRVPKELDSAHKTMMQRLQQGQQANFDQVFIREQMQAHREAVSLFSSYARNGRNNDLKSFAEKTLPTLQQHQTQVQDLEKSAGGALTGGSSGSSGKTSGSAGKSQSRNVAPQGSK